MLFRAGPNWVTDYFLRRGWLVRRPRLRRRWDGWNMPATVAAQCAEHLERRVLLSNIVVNSTSGGLNYASTVTVGDLNPTTKAVTLRDAVNAVNNTGGDQTITFDASIFPTNRLTPTTITLTGGTSVELRDSTGKTTIKGPGAGQVAVSGNNVSTVFVVDANVNAAIYGLTISGGHTSFAGGGIDNGGTLTLQNDIITGNSAGVFGGGIYNDYGGVLAITGSTLSHNSAGSGSGTNGSGYGGGFLNFGSVTVTASTLSNNSAGTDGGGFCNGGPGNNGADSVTVTDSTFSSNFTGNNGGGFYNYYNGVVSITGSTFSGNSAVNSAVPVSGGGFYNDYNGTVTVASSTFSGNSAAVGGGFCNNGGSVTVIDSTMSDNSASQQGGGFFTNYYYHDGHLAVAVTVTGSTFFGNSAGQYGGGFVSNYGNVAVTDSTFSSNAALYGGGFYVVSFGYGTVTVTDSTFSGNSAVGGGGCYNDYSGVVFTASTVADNFAINGGGVYNNGYYAALFGTILAGNTVSATNATSSDWYGSAADTSSSYNLIGDGTNTGLTSGGANHNIVGDTSHPVDPHLAPLANNGGPTQTMALLAGSPAINTGYAFNDPISGLPITTDQRGDPFSRVVGGTADIGAFEVQVSDLVDKSPVKTVNATEGKSTGNVVLATFTDGNPSASASAFAGTTANWGGALVGTPTVSVQLVSRSATVSTWNVVGKATYADAGTFNVTVTVHDTDGNPLVTAKTSFKVADAPLTNTTSSATRTAHRGQSTGTVVLATFTDANPYATASDFAGTTVNWGGALVGTPTFSVQLVSRSATASLWKVVGSAVYANTGLFTVTVTVNDVDGSTITSKKTWFLVIV